MPDSTTATVPSKLDGKGLRWRARYVDEDGREHAKGFRTKTEATSWLNGIVAAQETGSYIDPALGKVTFSSFYKDWAPRQVWETSTRHVMDQMSRSVTFASVPFADLRPSHVEAWVKSMQDADLEPSTIKTRFTNARTVLRAALRDRLMARDVTDKVRLPRQRKAAAAMQIPAVSEVGAMLKTEQWIGVFIAVCAFAGLRRGEASALQVGDIDFLRRELHVRRQVQWTDDGQMELRPPKYGSERTVYIPERLTQLLSEHVARRRPGDDPSRWVFPGRLNDALPVHAATVGRAWRAARGDMTYRLHELRHFFASGLIAAGCDVVTVQRALGHMSATETLKTYAHLWPDADDRTRKAAADLLDQALGATADALRTEAPKTASD
ncbi:site-specific integrase [Mycobacterium sp. M26]|uniref:tyrosine-type recombinase/integrase n=1 Tax=Mycobacterium sp. M26 TaxID=1762962 RepID=UPI0009E93EE1|nr:site-specific integrase [Mycobacterium sp. M26]